MQDVVQITPASKKLLWSGNIISAIPVLMMLTSAVMKFLKPASLVEEMARLGYDDKLALPIGIAEMACIVIYLIPRTSVLGAILLTGYLGGATATHIRVGDPFFIPIILGMFIWLGLFLRDERLRVLIPLRNQFPA
jgi:hypothetical protein